jgi:chemotaxis protein MotB
MTTLAPAQMRLAPPARRLWLITFVDLVMLLLAFFVLLFAMSRVDPVRYAAVASGYAAAFDALGGADEAVIGPQRVPAPDRVPGDDLAYLETVLKAAVARTPGLESVGFRLTGQYLILDLPAAATADRPGETIPVLDAAAQRLVFAVGGVLSNLPNRIAVVVTPPGVDRDAWQLARARGVATRDALAGAGYGRAVAVLVRGADAPEATVARTRILLLPETES